jgi:hypothetical protein
MLKDCYKHLFSSTVVECPFGWTRFLDNCYYFLQLELTWDTAKVFCNMLEKFMHTYMYKHKNYFYSVRAYMYFHFDYCCYSLFFTCDHWSPTWQFPNGKLHVQYCGLSVATDGSTRKSKLFNLKFKCFKVIFFLIFLCVWLDLFYPGTLSAP